MKRWMWLPCLAVLPWTGQAAVLSESTPSGSFTLDTRSQQQCLAAVGAEAVLAGRGLWDVTGAYATTVNGAPLSLALVHDTRGKLSGTGTLTVNTGKGLVAISMPIRGSAQGRAGSLALVLALQGTDPARTQRVALTLRLALDPLARQLRGTVSGIRAASGASEPLPTQPVTLTLPAPMDGTWSLRLNVVYEANGIRGTGRLTLSNGVEYDHAVSGKYADQAALLMLAGRPAYPVAAASTLRATITPLTGSPAGMTAFSGTLYGLTVAW